MSDPVNEQAVGAAASRSEGTGGPMQPKGDAFGPEDSPMNVAERQEQDGASADAGASTQQGK